MLIFKENYDMIDEISNLQFYLPVVIFFVLAFGLSLVFYLLPIIFAPSSPGIHKNAAYECGFPAFEDARKKFDVQFYLVAILFIIIDLDIAFIFPWAVMLFDQSLDLTRGSQLFAFFSMMIFIFVFIVGFAYEWAKGALEWR